MRGQRRAVITGIGVVAPNGIGRRAFWDSLLACRSGVGPVTLFDTIGFPPMAAGEVKDFRLGDFLNSNGLDPRRLARHTQLALVAAKFALEDAGLALDVLRTRSPFPLVMGVSTSAADVFMRHWQLQTKLGPTNVGHHMIGSGRPHAVAEALTRFLQLPLSLSTVSTACVAGTEAVARGAHLVVTGAADIAIAGAADAPITSFGMAGFLSSRLVPRIDGRDPSRVSRPFDRDRIGGFPAEGAAVLIIEELRSALSRGAPIYTEIAGWHGNCDEPDEEPSAGLSRTMGGALAGAGLTAGDVDYVCAAGPSDPVLDRVETAAIKAALGAAAYRIPVTSIKGATGNPLSAAGPLQVATAAMAMEHGLVPPTVNYEHPDPACDLDYVPGAPRRARLGAAVVNSHGLGGTNFSVVLRRVDP